LLRLIQVQGQKYKQELLIYAPFDRAGTTGNHPFYQGRRKPAIKVVDIFGNDPMTIVEVTVGGEKSS